MSSTDLHLTLAKRRNFQFAGQASIALGRYTPKRQLSLLDTMAATLISIGKLSSTLRPIRSKNWKRQIFSANTG